MQLSDLSTWLRRQGRDLVALHDTPHAVAGGVAIGLLIGFTPLVSVKTLLAIGLAALFRCNKVAAAIAVTLHDLSLPISPLMMRLEYGIGHWLLSSPHQWPPEMKVHHLNPAHWLHPHVLVELVWPMLIGSLVIGIPIAVVTYFGTYSWVVQFRARRDAREAAKEKGIP